MKKDKEFEATLNVRMVWNSYLGSQCAIRKSKLILVTNMSDSNLISWTDGGGNAMARATMPRSTVGDFRLWEKEYCGRRRHSIRTTWKEGEIH